MRDIHATPEIGLPSVTTPLRQDLLTTKYITMGPEMIGAIMGQVGNQKANLFNFANSQLTGWQNRRFTREMFNKSYDANVRLWQMNNDWNTPSAQKQRLIDAGLNPALMYGGKAGGGVASQTPSGGDVTGGHMESSKFIQGANMLNAMYDLEAKATQNEYLKRSLDSRVYALEEDRFLKHWNREDRRHEVQAKRDYKYGGKNWYEMETDRKSLRRSMDEMDWQFKDIELKFLKANKWIYMLSKLAGAASGFVKPR